MGGKNNASALILLPHYIRGGSIGRPGDEAMGNMQFVLKRMLETRRYVVHLIEWSSRIESMRNQSSTWHVGDTAAY